jgi:hypothetical protein
VFSYLLLLLEQVECGKTGVILAHKIASLARKRADAIEDPEVLRRLIVKISIVKTSIEFMLHYMR